MLIVLRQRHEEVFLGLLFQTIVTDQLTVEHKYLSALLAMPGVLDSPLFTEVGGIPGVKDDLNRSRFMELRGAVLEAIFSSIPTVLGSPFTQASVKTSIYRCVNLLASSMVSNEKVSLVKHAVTDNSLFRQRE